MLESVGLASSFYYHARVHGDWQGRRSAGHWSVGSGWLTREDLPVSTAIVAWIAHAIRMEAGGRTTSPSSGRVAWSEGGSLRGGALMPVFVDRPAAGR